MEFQSASTSYRGTSTLITAGVAMVSSRIVGVKTLLVRSNVRRAIVLAALILLSFSTVGKCGTIELAYTFDQPVLQSVVIDGQVFTRVFMPGAPNSGRIGHPALPGKGARILIPYGEEVVGVEVNAGGRGELIIDNPIEPVGSPFPLSATPDEIPPLEMDGAVYALDSPIPENRYSEIGTQVFRGFRILVVQLNPVAYVPASGTLIYHSNLSVKVTTTASSDPASLIHNTNSDRATVSAKVDNPAELVSYTLMARQPLENYDMLIICPDEFVEAYAPLKEYHDTTGVLTEIHSLSTVGSTNPVDIRDYIRQEFEDNGIQYVLIGADANLIPPLGLYVISFDRPDAPIEYSMPADFYFSCLDGTFNYDGDSRWGESTDGDGGGEIDLFPDVHVGRVSAGSVDEVDNLVNKTLAYAASEHPVLQKVLLVGEQLTFGGLGEYGGYAMEEMVDASDAHGYLTHGFPSTIYDIDKLYDVMEAPDNYWSPGELFAKINNGVHIIDHLGHSSGHYAMRTDTAMLRQNLSNDNYCFLYAEGCSAGRFDDMDCWAEYVTVKLAHGGFGCVANARLGLGSRSTAHPVHVFNREFWDAIYHAEEGKPQIGHALSGARADHIYHINDPGIRWTFYELTLFGDPALAIKSVRDVVFTFPNGVPDKVPPDTGITCEVRVSGIGIGEPIPGTGRVHYSVDGGAVTTAPMIELLPRLYEATLPEIGCESEVEFYFSVDEDSLGQISCPEPGSAFHAHAVSQEVIIFADDFETDQGWVISGGLWERGVPLGQGGEELQYPVPDPSEGCNGPQVLGYNLAGDYANNLPAVHVTSPAINCVGMEDVHLRFCRWLGVERPLYDDVSIQVSTDGMGWSVIWENPSNIADLEWDELEYDISAIADNQPTVYLRWTMGPTDGGLRLIGWNIDNVRVVSYQCITCDCSGFCDLNFDGVINPVDVVMIVNYVYKQLDGRESFTLCPMENGDWDCDNAVNPIDVVYYTNFVYKSTGTGPCDPCTQ